MAIKQLFYTSCKKGISSGMGFQTHSMSKGITDEERKEIESYCVYIPPDNLPTLPSPGEIDKLFPIALSSFKLKNNKYCICNSKYIGKDYSGRYGNYFCHVLVSEEPWDFYPIELYGSPIFREYLTYEEQEEDIKYLPELEQILLGDIINFDTVSRFLKKGAVDEKGKAFVQLMESILDYNEKGKRIIYCDDIHNMPFWIGAALMCLPKKLAQQFSFTTYCYNPQDLNYIICAVDEKGSKFDFKDSKKLYKYNAHNFCDKINGEANCSSSFIKLAEIGYTISKEVFLPFIEFICQFEYNFLDKNINNCVSLYNIVKSGIEKSTVENIKKALHFAIQYKSVKAYNQLFNMLNPKLEKISTQVDLELLEIITKFLFTVGLEEGNKEHMRRTYEFFFNSLHYLLVDIEEIPLQDIIDLYDRIRNLAQECEKNFFEYWINPDRIKSIVIYIQGGKIRHAKFYFNTMVRDIIIFGNNCDIQKRKILFTRECKENIAVIFSECLSILIKSPEDILDVLNYFKYDYEYFAYIVLRIYHINNYSNRRNEVEKLLADFILDQGNEDNEWKKKVYFEINKLNHSENFMFSIYNFQLMENGAKDNFFINYCDNVFCFFKEYRDKKFSQSLEMYLCNKDIYLQEYKDIVNYIEKNSLINIISKSVLEKLFTGFEEKLRIEDYDGENYIIEKCVEIKSKYKIKTPLNITELLYMGTKIQNYKGNNQIEILKKIKVNFSNMEEYQYEEYLKWFLSNICIYLHNPEEHFKIYNIFYCDVYSSIFYNVYIDTLEDIMLTKKYKDALKNYNIEGHTIFLDFVICAFKNLDNIDEKLQQILDNRIIDILAKIPERKLKEYNNYFTERVKRFVKVEQIVTKWNDITTKVHEKNKNKVRFKFFKK